jgi:hypothetical protein
MTFSVTFSSLGVNWVLANRHNELVYLKLEGLFSHPRVLEYLFNSDALYGILFQET